MAWVDEWEDAVDLARKFKLHAAGDLQFLWNSFPHVIAIAGYGEWCEEFAEENWKALGDNNNTDIVRLMVNNARHVMATNSSRITNALLRFYKYSN